MVESLLQVERSQLRRFGHVSRMSQERLVRHVLLDAPMGKWPRGCPRASWSDYISDLAWYRLSVEPAKLSEIAVDREAFRALLVQLSLRSSPEEKYENK